MGFISEILGYPLGWLMWLCYRLFSNYGLALLLFTVLTRLLLLPLNIKQQKATAQMSALKPQIDEIQKRYAGNRQKINEETMNLYKMHGQNPTAGCLPMLIQLPILFGLIDVIYKPLTHLARAPKEVIEAAKQIMVSNGLGDLVTKTTEQLGIISTIRETPQLFTDAIGADLVQTIQSLNLSFFGMDLNTIPHTDMFRQIFSVGFNPVLLIPVLSGLSALLLSLQSLRNTPASAAGASSVRGMMLTMPLFSVVIAFQVPAGVGLYWTFSSLVGIAQSAVLYKLYNPKEMAEKAKAELAKKQEDERLARLEAKKLAKEGKLEDKEKAMTQKEINRLKLAEARKRDAEKYGETYEDVTDDDLC